MAVTFVNINISNPLGAGNIKKPIRCVLNRSLFTNLIITKEIAEELGFKEIEKRQVLIGNGPAALYSYVGPIKIEIDGRIGFSGALVDDSPQRVMCYLGSIIMSELDLEIVYEPTIKLIVNPKSIIAKQT